jgi:uncharacterized membrane protein YkvI
MENPIDGLLPDFTIFGAEFTELWQKIFAGLWGLAVIAVIIFLVLGIASMATAGAGNPQARVDAKKQAIWSGAALGGLVALGVIVGAVIAIFNQ